MKYDDRFLGFVLILAFLIGLLIPAKVESEKSSRGAGSRLATQRARCQSGANNRRSRPGWLLGQTQCVSGGSRCMGAI